MAIKHKIVINVSDPNGRKANVLRGADVKLPARLLKFLFGDFTQVYLLSPGNAKTEIWIRAACFPVQAMIRLRIWMLRTRC